MEQQEPFALSRNSTARSAEQPFAAPASLQPSLAVHISAIKYVVDMFLEARHTNKACGRGNSALACHSGAFSNSSTDSQHEQNMLRFKTSSNIPENGQQPAGAIPPAAPRRAGVRGDLHMPLFPPGPRREPATPEVARLGRTRYLLTPI